MGNGREVVVLSGVRTAIGDYCGALKDVAPTELAGQIVREAVRRAKIDPQQVGQLVFGNVIHGEAKDMYFSRVACIKGGLPQETTALTVNRLCGSGMQAIVSAAQGIMLGDCDAAVGGGAESMSRGGYLLPALRWGQRMNDGGAIDMMVGAVTDPFEAVHMGITAENIAAQWKISREQQDEFSVESHRRAINAIEKGHFKDQILPIELKTRKGTTLFDRDEHPRADVTLEGLAKLRTAFKKEGGSVTAGNASPISDGAAALVVMEKEKALATGVRPRFRIGASTTSAGEPEWFTTAPVQAISALLKKSGFSLSDIDLFEINEAFAASSIVVNRELGLDPEKVNVRGGAVALGHPIGASGARILTTLIHAMEDLGKKRGIAALCIGGGEAVAMMVERV